MSDTARHPKLIIRPKDGRTEERDLTKSPFTIGRKQDNDLVLDDGAVSAHHAKIEQIQSAYFLEDLRSTNGTQVNGQRIDRRQLQDADVIAVGHFRLVYRGDSIAESVPRTTDTADLDQTMAFTGQFRPEPAKQTPAHATLQVLAGGTGEDRYDLTQPVTVIGAKHDATIRLNGWFAPKVAAIIARRGTHYILTPSGSGKKVRINDEPVLTPLQLEDGDRIEVGGLIARFAYKADRKAA